MAGKLQGFGQAANGMLPTPWQGRGRNSPAAGGPNPGLLAHEARVAGGGRAVK